jgi:hypothetical protein
VAFELIDTSDLKIVAKALAEQADGKELRAELVKNLRKPGNQLATKVRAAWKAAPSHGHDTATRGRRGEPDLRVLLAKATRVQVRLAGKEVGVRVRTDGRRMPNRMKALPTYAEGTKPRWRHPSWGNRDAWGQQRPFPRFYQAVQPDESRARAAVEQAVEAVLDKIAKAR